MSNADCDPIEPWPVRHLIEQAVAEWLDGRPGLAHPIDDPALGNLAILITRRLVEAGLIDPDQDDNRCDVAA